MWAICRGLPRKNMDKHGGLSHVALFRMGWGGCAGQNEHQIGWFTVEKIDKQMLMGIQEAISTYWCLAGNGWEWGNGISITSDYGSFPHSLVSTSKSISHWSINFWFIQHLGDNFTSSSDSSVTSTILGPPHGPMGPWAAIQGYVNNSKNRNTWICRMQSVAALAWESYHGLL